MRSRRGRGGAKPWGLGPIPPRHLFSFSSSLPDVTVRALTLSEEKYVAGPNEASRARMVIETCEKCAFEGVGRVVERAGLYE